MKISYLYIVNFSLTASLSRSVVICFHSTCDPPLILANKQLRRSLKFKEIDTVAHAWV